MPSRAPSTPDLPHFTTLAQTHTLIPVTRTFTADLETPVSAFLRLTQPEGGEAAPEAFLFESVEGGEHVARWTFIGLNPYRTLTAHGNRLTTVAGAECISQNPLASHELPARSITVRPPSKERAHCQWGRRA